MRKACQNRRLVFRRNEGDDFDEVSTFGKKARNIKKFMSTGVDKFEGIRLMNELDELN